MDYGVTRTPSEWTVRSEHWLRHSDGLDAPLAARQRRSSPLILTGDGVHMCVEKGSLHIRGGRTHFPQQPETYRFFRGDLNMPPRIVAVDCSGALSFDVIAWLAEQGVALICVDWKGDGVSVLSCDGYTADRDKVAWQIATRADPQARLEFSIDLILQKLRTSIETLETALPPSKLRDSALNKACECVSKLSETSSLQIDDLRGIEGVAAASYFRAWRGFPMKWKSTARYPVSDAWLAFDNRSSFLTGVKGKNFRASHPLNALLNYAYGMLQNRLQIEAVANGFDPTLGIMHHGRLSVPAYILDIMEPERPKVDAAILRFVSEHAFSGADFVIRNDGVCRLSPQLARFISTMLGGRKFLS